MTARKPFAYVTKQGKVVRSSELDKYSLKEGSQQIEDSFTSSDIEDRGLVSPPYNPASMINLLEVNTYHMRSCRVKSQDVAGHGWEIVPATSGPDTDDDESQARKTLLEEWFSSIGDLTKVLADGQFDYESIGWGAIEITFGITGLPVNMFHVPAHTLRAHKNRTKWLQRRGNKRVWFKDINSDRQIDRLTGREFFLPESDMNTASTIMTWHNTHPRSDYYGVSDIIPALGAITGDVSRRDYNISFFDNFGVPAYAVFITGDFDPGEPKHLDGDDPDNPTGPTPLEEQIEEQFKELAQNPHSILVMTIPTTISDDFGGDGGKVEIEIQPLSVETKEASFRMYRQDNRDEVLTAHGVDPYRVGIAESGSLGGSTAQEASDIYKESIIHPRQQQLEVLINHHIIVEMFGIRDWRFKLNEIDTTNAIEDLQLLTGMFTMGAVTPRQIIEHYSARFGLDTTSLDHPALNAHYIGGHPVDIEMADVALPADQVVASLNSLHDSLIESARKSNGHVSTEDFAQLKRSLEELRAMI